MNVVYAIIAAIASGILGAMGMGGGGILMIYLTLIAGIDHSVSQGINLLFFIPSAVIAIIIYIKKKLIDLKIAIPFATAGVFGALAGSYISGMLDSNILSKMFGIFLLYIGVRELFSKAK